MIWWAIAVLAVGTYAMKAVGPLLLGARTLPAWLNHVSTLMVATLLAALVAISTFTDGRELNLDIPLTAGMASAIVAIRLRAPFVVVVIVAAAVAAALRALS
jgi:branched-subunit amino acid transport protein